MSGAIGDIAAKMTGDDEFQEHRRRSDTWGQSLEGAAKVCQVSLAAVKSPFPKSEVNPQFTIHIQRINYIHVEARRQPKVMHN